MSDSPGSAGGGRVCGMPRIAVVAAAVVALAAAALTLAALAPVPAGAAVVGPAAVSQPAALAKTLVAAGKTISTDTKSNTRARRTVASYPDAKFACSLGNVLFFNDGIVTVHGSRSAFTEHIAKDEQCTGSQRALAPTPGSSPRNR